MKLIGNVEWRRVGGDPTFVFRDGDSVRFYDSEAALLRHFRTLGLSPEIRWPPDVASPACAAAAHELGRCLAPKSLDNQPSLWST